MKDKDTFSPIKYREVNEVVVDFGKNQRYSMLIAKENVNTFKFVFSLIQEHTTSFVLKEFLFKLESSLAYYDNEDMFSKKEILERCKEIAEILLKEKTEK